LENTTDFCVEVGQKLWELTNKVLCAARLDGLEQCVGSRNASKFGRDGHLFRAGGSFRLLTAWARALRQDIMCLPAWEFTFSAAKSHRRQLVGAGRFALSRNGCRRWFYSANSLRSA
jgi:hypothetical protein